MPRAKRRESSSGIYHIILRGNNRRLLFFDDQDCCQFLRTLEKVRTVSGFHLYAYVLMNNHVHLLLQEGDEKLATIFKRLCTSYASYLNKRHDACGHLFEDRFHSVPVETEWAFLNVLRYICQNPVKAGLCTDPFSYRWTGCCGVMDPVPPLIPDSPDHLGLTADGIHTFVCASGEFSNKKVIDWNERMLDSEAVRVMQKIAETDHIPEIAGWKKSRRNDVLRKGRKAGISISQLSRITGISKGIIRRVCKAATTEVERAEGTVLSL